MTNRFIKTIDVHQLKNKMISNPTSHYIDVREQEEWDQGHILGTIHIPKKNISTQVLTKVADKTSPIYLLCQGGVRSLDAAQRLIEQGYKEVYSVDGGLMQWIKCGYPIQQVSLKSVIAETKPN